MKISNLIIRIISCPFMLGLLLIAHNWFAIKRSFLFLIYGGEATLYDKKDKHTIQDIYHLLKEQHDKKND